MPMVPTTLQAQIEQAFKDMRDLTQSDGDNSDAAIAQLAADLTVAIDAYIRSATVISTGAGGVTGTAVGPTGAAVVVGLAPLVSSQGNIT